MKVLLHICCAPCAIYPLKVLRDEGFEVMGFFYNRNIHPYQESQRRERALRDYAEEVDLKVIYQEGYDMEGFLRNIVFREANRCSFCYHDRLDATAALAKRGKFDHFTSTLLQSKFQKHDMIRTLGKSVSKSRGVPFLYRDFREGWKEGIQTSKYLNMYRQQYCGCVYSEKERYFKEEERSSD